MARSGKADHNRRVRAARAGARRVSTPASLLQNGKADGEGPRVQRDSAGGQAAATTTEVLTAEYDNWGTVALAGVRRRRVALRGFDK